MWVCACERTVCVLRKDLISMNILLLFYLHISFMFTYDLVGLLHFLLVRQHTSWELWKILKPKERRLKTIENSFLARPFGLLGQLSKGGKKEKPSRMGFYGNINLKGRSDSDRGWDTSLSVSERGKAVAYWKRKKRTTSLGSLASFSESFFHCVDSFNCKCYLFIASQTQYRC